MIKLGPSVTWGSWVGAHKTCFAIDHESKQINRQKATFGHYTIAHLKDLNVLLMGCECVGMETAKNLILSNVGGVALWDRRICEVVHHGSNFYVTPEHVGMTTLAKASLGELRSLNPFCCVDTLDCEVLEYEVLLDRNDLRTGHSYAAVVMPMLLPKNDMFCMNEVACKNGITFTMALNNGTTPSILSDFGPCHEISNATGEPTQTLVVSNFPMLRCLTRSQNCWTLRVSKKEKRL